MRQSLHHVRKPLTDRQRRFVLEYLKDYNTTAAAKRAGHAGKSARSADDSSRKRMTIVGAIARMRVV